MNFKFQAINKISQIKEHLYRCSVLWSNVYVNEHYNYGIRYVSLMYSCFGYNP